MDILYLILPLSMVVVGVVLAIVVWAIQSGQYDDIAGEGERVLDEDR